MTVIIIQSDEYDLEDSYEYLQIEIRRIENFQRTLEEWITSLSTEHRILDHRALEDEETETSRVGTTTASRRRETASKTEKESTTITNRNCKGRSGGESLCYGRLRRKFSPFTDAFTSTATISK